MSWPSWHTTAPPLTNIVSAPPPLQSAVLPNAVNPATTLLPPPTAAAAAGAVPAGMQYSPEQWAQMQQQNWQQWAQWQQQYQQWHQQYGAEYQKSMSALTASNTNTSVPPPPPNENKPPPPPPPDDGLKSTQYNTAQARPASGYSTVPTQQYNTSGLSTQYSDKTSNQWQNSNSKRVLPQAEEYEGTKRQMLDNQNQWNKQDSAKGSSSWQNQPPPNSQSQTQKVLNLEELTEAEKKFDKEFAAWEAQFNKWKEQNANHPDKTQYLEYEKKWESWRNSLLERREQMRKKRVALQASISANPPKPAPALPQQSFSQPPPLSQAYSTQKDQLPVDIFTKPPPTQNNEPLAFKKMASHADEKIQNESPNTGGAFLKSSSPVVGGIPGLDLVKEGADQGNSDDYPSEPKDVNSSANAKGPDLDAISKGINTILGDPKLLNMLSIVSQNQNLSSGNPVDTQPKIHDTVKPAQKSNAPIPSLLSMPVQRPISEKSEHSYNEYSETYSSSQLETVNNFDDQTRMSFSNGPNEVDVSYVNNSVNSGRPDKTNNFRRFSSDNKYMFSGSTNNDYKFPKSTTFESSHDIRTHSNQPGSFRNMNGPGMNANNDLKYRNTHANFSNNYPQKFNDKYLNHHYAEDGVEEQWNEEDEYEKYHNMFSEADESVEVPLESSAQLPTQENPPIDEEPLFVPEVVVDYEHKSLKEPEPEVSLDVIRMFDYRHKPVNRIPYPQRPTWLSSCLRNIRQFDPLGTGRFNSNDRTPHFEPPRFPMERNDHFERRTNFDDRDSKSNDERHRYHKYPEMRNDWRSHTDNQFDREKQRDRYDYSPRRNKDTNFRNTDLGISRNRYSEDRDDKIQHSERKLDLEELSDDEWVDDKSYSNRDNSKCSPSERNINSASPNADIINQGSSIQFTQNTTLDDLINPPGRYNRPPKIVIILRGPPGSGKTHLAKLIKDREVENGGSAPRILSLDDYFMVEHEKDVIEDGKPVRIKEMTYEYEEEMEESYRQSLTKSFKKTIMDGYFHFVVVDNVNQKVKNFGEMWSFAKQNGFQVYICQLDLDPDLCIRRNIHQRNESYIEDCIAGWEPTPAHHPLVDATNFLQSAGAITEVEMEEAEIPQEENDTTGEDHGRSKWDTFDCSLNNLAKLDGVSKPLRPSRTMEEYLQLENEWEEPCKPTKPGQKRVRWADLEECKQQKKMKALGFVVGQTDWNRIMDPTSGESALRQTKYI